MDAEQRWKELEQALANAKKDADSFTKDLDKLRDTQRSCSELQDKCVFLSWSSFRIGAAACVKWY